MPDPASASKSAPASEPIPKTPCGRAEQRSGRRIRASDCLSEVQRSEFELEPACREPGFLGLESKFAEPQARPQGAVLRTAAKLASDPNNPPDFGPPFLCLLSFGEAKEQ
jgi:hypothetical protein